MNNVCRASGTDERQRCQHTSSIRAGSPSITRAPQLRPTPSKHITKARDYFWKHDSTTAAMQTREHAGRVRTHKTRPLLPPHFGATSGSLLSCHLCVGGPIGAIVPSRGVILTVHQPARQYALTNSHFRPRCLRGEESLDCFEHLLSIFFLSLSLSLSHPPLFNGSHTKPGIHARQISAPSPRPYSTIAISSSVTTVSVLHNLVSTFPACSPVFSLSAFYRMQFCCSAPNKFTEHVLNTGKNFAFDTNGGTCSVLIFYIQ